jgi:ATP-binding cassette subfamily B protein
VLLDGFDLRELTLESLRAQMAVMLQETVLFEGTIRDNIALGALGDVDDAEVEWAARVANVHGFVERLPDGYDTVVGERGAKLSGGERQRIAIARAALRRAPVVLLDEPAAGLDERNEREVTEALGHLTAGATTFLVTHDLAHARGADLIVYMERGRIVERGAHDELMRLGGAYAAMVELLETGRRLTLVDGGWR